MNKAPTARKRKSAVLLRMGKYFGRHKLLVVLAFFLTIASNLLALLGPYLSGCAINAIDTPDGIVDLTSVFFYCALIGSVLHSFGCNVLSFERGYDKAEPKK